MRTLLALPLTRLICRTPSITALDLMICKGEELRVAVQVRHAKDMHMQYIWFAGMAHSVW